MRWHESINTGVLRRGGTAVHSEPVYGGHLKVITKVQIEHVG